MGPRVRLRLLEITPQKKECSQVGFRSKKLNRVMQCPAPVARPAFSQTNAKITGRREPTRNSEPRSRRSGSFFC